jgi:predicted deacylase
MAVETKLDYAVATLTDDTEVRTPYWRLDTGVEGETFLVTAAQHGNEVQGCEVIRRFKQVCERDLKKGTVYLVPFTNLPAVRYRRPHISLGPEQPYADAEGHNMNRTWPGDPDGNDTERVSYSVHEAAVRHATRCLDLHSWSKFTATATLTRSNHDLASQMAELTATRFIRWSVASPPKPETTTTTITSLFNDTGRAANCIELSGQYIILEKQVRVGLRAAINLAKFFGMMDGEPELLDGPVLGISDETKDEQHTLEAPCCGMFVEAGLETSDYVEKGQKLGHIIRDEDLEIVEIIAPVSGYLWSYGCHRANCDVALPEMHPYAGAGDTLATVVAP